jgi:hypothetical protein
MSKEKPLYSLIPLEDFKVLMGVDDREDKTARFCLVTSTFSIEQYCKRRFLRKKHFERLPYTGDLHLPLNEYPIQKILAVYTLLGNSSVGEMLEPDFYQIIPECGTDIDLPFSVSLSPAFRRYRGLSALKVLYCAGYAVGNVPADLVSACLELAAWNMNRYRGRRIGMTGSVRKEGEHFEMSMPENVKALLETYRRKTI